MNWQPIETFNRGQSGVFLVTEDSAVRLQYWTSFGQRWETLPPPVIMVLTHGDSCACPTHWMPCPEPPTEQ